MTSSDQTAAPDTDKQPAQMSVLSQYVRSVSFENAAARRSENPSGKPNISVQVNVTHDPIGNNRYNVALIVTIAAAADEKEIFGVKLEYIGVFQLTNVREDALAPVLSIECPRLLFPFARRIIAEVTRDGGFPPLMLDPIDFATLFRQQAARRAAAAAAAPTTAA